MPLCLSFLGAWEQLTPDSLLCTPGSCTPGEQAEAVAPAQCLQGHLTLCLLPRLPVVNGDTLQSCASGISPFNSGFFSSFSSSPESWAGEQCIPGWCVNCWWKKLSPMFFCMNVIKFTEKTGGKRRDWFVCPSQRYFCHKSGWSKEHKGGT